MKPLAKPSLLRNDAVARQGSPSPRPSPQIGTNCRAAAGAWGEGVALVALGKNHRLVAFLSEAVIAFPSPGGEGQGEGEPYNQVHRSG
jgi:hypothetical protein